MQIKIEKKKTLQHPQEYLSLTKNELKMNYSSKYKM